MTKQYFFQGKNALSIVAERYMQNSFIKPIFCFAFMLIIAGLNTLIAQPTNTTCYNAIPLCPGVTYDNQSTGGSTGAIYPPISLWSCNGVLDGPIFYTFSTNAANDPIVITINGSCTGASIQAGIFQVTNTDPNCENETWSSTGNCDQQPNSVVLNTGSSLQPNTIYYLVIDNHPGQTCAFSINITGNASFSAPGMPSCCPTTTPPPILVTTSASPASLCIPNNSVLTADATGGFGGPYTYTWDNGLGVGKDKTVSPTVTTTYTVTVTEACSGFSQTSSVTVNVGEAPKAGTLSASSTNVCTGGSTTLTLTNFVGNIQYQTAPAVTGPWTNVAGGTSSVLTLGPLTSTFFVRVLVSGTCGGSVYSNTLPIRIVQKPSVTATNATICEGSSATITATPSIAGGTYSWSTGETTASISVNPNTTTSYTVQYILNGCSSNSVNSIVTVNSKPILTTNNDTICLGDSTNLQPIVSTSGGSYLWSTGENTSQITVSPLQSSAYWVVYTLNGCKSDTGFFNVTVNLLPTITIEDDSICNGESIQISSTVSQSGGDYLWNSGNTSSTITVSPTSTTLYSVQYTLNGCTSLSDTAYITIKPIPNITVANVSICENDTTSLTALPDLAGGSFLWSNGETSSTISVWPSVTTNYSVIYTLNGCSSTSQSGTVTVKPNPIVSTTNASICLGDTAMVTASSNLSGGTLLWDEGNQSTASIFVSPTSTTSYAVTYTLNGCESQIAYATVTVNSLPGVFAGRDTTLCFGDSLTLIASGAQSYTWSTGETTSAITVSPTSTTTYYVNGFSSSCPGSDTVVVRVSQPLNTSFNSTNLKCNSVCEGEINLLTTGGIGSYTYSWTPSVSTTSYASNLCAGNYDVIINDSIGCSNSISVQLTEPPVLAASTSATSASCKGKCDGSAEVIASGGTGSYTYDWQSGSTNSIAQNLCGGNQEVKITDQNGCNLILNVLVPEPDSVKVIAFSDTSICIGTSASLFARGSGGLGSYTYKWSTGENNDTIIVNPSSTTPYSVVATDSMNCSSFPDIVLVTLKDPLNINISPDKSICLNEPTVLSVIATGGDGNYKAIWQPDSLIGLTVNASPLTTTNYTVSVSDGCGSPNKTGSVKITVLPSPVANFYVDTNAVCAGNCITFIDSSYTTAGSISNYSWLFTDGTTAINKEMVKCFNDPGKYGATLIVSTSNGCKDTIKISDIVTILPQPKADFYFTPEVPNSLSPIVSFINSSSSEETWLWDFGDGSESGTKENPTYTYADTGNYCVQLKVASQFGCKDSITKCLRIEPNVSFYIPNAFSPNEDGLNEVFRVYGAGWDIEKYEMLIFSRWGNIIFSSSKIEEGWDGKGPSGLAPIDTYVYLIKVKLKNGRTDAFNGSVNLIR